VILDFWMHSIYKCISKVFGIFYAKVEVRLGFVFRARACKRTLISLGFGSFLRVLSILIDFFDKCVVHCSSLVSYSWSGLFSPS
jgi:hypothetical protein